MQRSEPAVASSLSDLWSRQRRHFASGATLPVETRLRHLKTLEVVVEKNVDAIAKALYEDLGKSAFEAYGTETLIVLKEIEYFLHNLRHLVRPRRVDTPLFFAISRSEIHYQPYGQVLVLAPWNYPLQLTLTPVVGALAAGNTVVAKPSEFAPATAALMERLLHDNFPEELVRVVNGGVDTARSLLELAWDYIFFTGSTAVGKLVYEAAARHLTPVTLELGGKSPCVVHRDADLKVAAMRIVWGKTVNAGQTCVAPDYLLVHETVQEAFVEELKKSVRKQYPPEPLHHPDYPRIVSRRHFERLREFLGQGRLLMGGRVKEETLQIEPSLLADCPTDAPVMTEEIFGPVLPIYTYKEAQEALDFIRQRPAPLALYVFTRQEKFSDFLLQNTQSGGACVNECLMHLANHRLPFGGIGPAGMGRYHGPFSFETFSHARAVMKRQFFPDLPQRYPPYNKLPMSLVKRFLKKLV
ncbi:MAG: aldehyde dehydrogenase [Flavobacteriales bacterium]|nr:aldehyde dehydrogenase [Flavobacteriales bacterium]MDW8431785.1 aldehyde dehydrogenase [Flavobacteriales bacterium]